MTKKRPLFWLFIGILFFVFLYLIRSILLPFVLGIFIAYFLDPAADRLERMKLTRWQATLIIIIGFFAAIGFLSLLIIPVIVNQCTGLIADLPGYVNSFDRQYTPELSHWLGGLPAETVDSVKGAAADFASVMVKMAGDFVANVFQSGMAFVQLISLILITPVAAFYLLRDWDYIITRIDNLLPRDHADTIRAQLAIIDRTLAGFLRGQINVCLIMGAYYAIALSLAGLKFGIVIGFVTGLLVIVPYAGWLLGMGIGLAVAFFQFDSSTSILIVFLIFLIGTVLEGAFITPNLVGNKVGLHPVWIIFGMLCGAALFGFVGILLAVPVTAVIGVLFRFATERYLQSEYYQGGRA